MIFEQTRLHRALSGLSNDRPPVWFMRQAGRYLPEYRSLRKTAPDFLSFCLDPVKASQATLQPMKRFPFDAAIVFADILLICKALGQDLVFLDGEGPKLGPLPDIGVLKAGSEKISSDLSPVGETLKRVRQDLPEAKALIGFCGGPWTVLTYMASQKFTDRSSTRLWAWSEPETVEAIIDILVQASANYLAMQARSGAQILKIFESWAEGLTETQFERLVIRPHREIISLLRQWNITVPIIGFPRGSGALALDYARKVPVTAVALDSQTPLRLGLEIQALKPIQGALDPLVLVAGGEALDRELDLMVKTWSDGAYIFNLGHGILPQTPLKHVDHVLYRLTGMSMTCDESVENI